MEITINNLFLGVAVIVLMTVIFTKYWMRLMNGLGKLLGIQWILKKLFKLPNKKD
ncbi:MULTISPECIES: hypothetical protein [unclassified Fusibacter]|uniref:hypothetical protein n=1 Tax=unclassified Fusibacter TaxID=2624464 RepID=UPI0013E962A6|nr:MULTISPECIES: hypothetical protein [unclassified Fusibacter]MCK8059592.1 hypothetical protein [Fusibacter sp. A2]NPE21393.1 hypothetical protein [Fusibacter sp. A1]